MFTKNKVFAYENSDGDKGIIIAKSIEEAKKIFHEKYPERKIVDNYYVMIFTRQEWRESS